MLDFQGFLTGWERDSEPLFVPVFNPCFFLSQRKPIRFARESGGVHQRALRDKQRNQANGLVPLFVAEGVGFESTRP